MATPSLFTPLFELRSYTLRPGRTPAFWQAQRERGYALVAPIQQRLVGYFSSADDVGEQVFHLYRYDGFDDWQQRLHGLYAVAALEPYFTQARALMTAQHNRFLAAAPVPALSPLWPLWRDGAAPRLAGATFDSVVELQTTQLLPGTQPRYWQAWRDFEGRAGALEPHTLIGCFVTVVGRQHEVLTLRHHAGAAAWQAARARRRADADWQALRALHEPLVVEDSSRLLQPAPEPELSPLFASTAGAAP